MNKQPNILYIFSDQHRKFDLGCYGHPDAKTPHIDALAAEGLRFEHCISNSPVCVPARGTLLTGLFAKKHKAFTNDIAIDPNCNSIAHVLKAEGYHTGYIGKWHINGIPREQAIPVERRLGFEEWKVHNCNHDYMHCHYYDENNVKHTPEGYEPVIFGELALDFLNRNMGKSQPWALVLSLATPHDPHMSIDETHLAPYQEKDIPLRGNTKDEILFQTDVYWNTEEYRERAKGYYGHITAIDEQVGKLVARLKAAGELENTIVIYSSDHGDMLGSQGLIDKQQPYEESIAIPLVAYWNNHIRKGVCDELIGLNDIPLTLAGLVGTQFTTETDGQDLQQLFVDESATSYESAYLYDYYPCHNSERKGGRAWRGVRTKQYTYAVHADDLNWLLFDNIADPLQQHNLAGLPEHQETQAHLWALLQGHIATHDALLEGLDYVKFAEQSKEFNESQRFFRLKNFAEE